MILLTFIIFQLGFSISNSKGIYSGVPCHRAYSCIFEDDDNSLLVGEETGVETEETCQKFCSETENCVSYSWWNENATELEKGTPLLCQLFQFVIRIIKIQDSLQFIQK